MKSPDDAPDFRLSAHPALLLFVGVSLGIWLQVSLDISHRGAWYLVVAGAAMITVHASWIARRRLVSPTRLMHYLAAALVGVSAGGIRAQQYALVHPNDAVHLLASVDELHLTIAGRVRSSPVTRNGRSRFMLDVDSVRTPPSSRFDRVAGHVHVTVESGDAQSGGALPRSGDAVAITGVLTKPYPRRNPADFDFRSFLERRRIRSTLHSSQVISILSAPRSRMRGAASRIESHIERSVSRWVTTERGRAVILALLLGRKGEIDPAVLEHFSRTGLMHVLAVSGLHVLMVGMIIYGLLCPALLRVGIGWRTMEITRALITLTLLIMYAMITGGSASVTRAVVMAAVFIGGVTLQRSAPALNSLSVAGCILVMMRPTYLWDVGFQLSFSAVAAIVTVNRTLGGLARQRWDDDSWQGRAARGMTTTIAATLGTSPVLLYHFGSVSAAGLVLNPVAIPATGLALSAGLLTIVADAVPLLASAFGHAADFFAHVLMQTAAVGDALFGWARVQTRLTHPPFVAALVLGTAFLAVLHEPRLRWRIAGASLAAIALGVWLSAASAGPRLEIVVFDVGQGDASLVQFPNGKCMLVDLGPRSAYSDAGRSVLLPHLAWIGQRDIDVVVVTHPHSDHLGGLPTLLRNATIHRLVHNGDNYDSNLFREVEALTDSLRLPSMAVSAGDTITIDRQVRVYVLAPSPALSTESNPNERSVVLRLEYGTTSFLLLGDAEGAAEEYLLRSFPSGLGADVIKVGHHGSRTSSRDALVKATSVDGRRPFAVISVARRNRFGLPNADVVERWRGAGAHVHLTYDRGALWLKSDGRSVRRVDWRK